MYHSPRLVENIPVTTLFTLTDVSFDELSKGATKQKKKRWILKGIASSNAVDHQGESVNNLQNAFDLTTFKWVNWEHEDEAPEDNVGKIIHKSFTDEGKLYIEVELFQDNDKAKEIVKLAKSLKESGDDVKLGFSIEGAVTQRGSTDKTSPLYNKILKAVLTGVAICKTPINDETYADFIEKGFKKAMDLEKTEPLQEESLEGKKKNIVNNNDDQDDDSHSVKLTKSQVYRTIFEHFPNISSENSKGVFNFISNFQHQNTMEENANQDQITNEALNRALETLKKGIKSTPQNSDGGENTQDEQNVESGVALIKGLPVGTKKFVAMQALADAGYSEDVIEKSYAAFAKDNSVNSVNIDYSKIEKSFTKGFDSIANSMTERFSAIGEVMESIVEENQSLKAENAELKKSVDSIKSVTDMISENLKKIGKQPIALQKSVTAVERFENGGNHNEEEFEGRTFNITDRIQKSAAVEAIDAIANKGDRIDTQLEQLAADLEHMPITHSTASSLLNKSVVEKLKSHDIQLVIGG